MGRAGTLAAVVALLVVSACGSQSEPSKSSNPSPADLEPATVAGLAAAVLTHLDGDSVKGTGGNRNKYEKWTAVSLEVEVAGAVVPLSVMVMEYTKETGKPSAADMCSDDPAVLSCRTEKADDGSTVGLTTSTEDLTGGISSKGLFAHVVHVRDDYLVLVTEDVPSRKPDYVDMTRLPLDVTVLKDIATDPLVGTHTSPGLNDAGKDLKGFSEG
jgi:hypothetical protein